MTGSQRQAPDVLPLGAVRAALMAASAPAPGRPGDAYVPDNRAPVYPVPVGPPAGDRPGPTTPGAVGPSAVRPGIMRPGDAPPGPTAAWPPPLCATTSARETLVPMTPADPALETPVAAPVLPGPVGRWLRSHPRAADSGLALFIFLLGSLSTVLQAQNPLAFQAIGVPGLVILALAQMTAGTALALRRARPLATWAVVILVMPVTEILTVLVLDPEKSALLYVSSMLMLTLLIGVPLMLGTLTVRVRTRWAWLAWVASTLAVQVPQIVLERYTFVESAMTLMALALVNMIGVLVGLNARSQRQRLAEVEARSARASLEREQTALLAAANERSRIAREMHDVVAHSLAVMITMADGAAATVERNPAVAKQAMETLAEAGRSALADTRRLVGVLREDPSVADGPTTDLIGSTDPEPAASSQSPEPPALSTASASSAHSHEVRDVPVPEFAPLGTVTPVEPSAPIASLRQQATDGGGDRSQGDLPLAPAPEQADITELVRRFEAAGVPVSYRWVGTALPEDKSLQLTVFRIAQEALTNVLRYAPTTPAVKVDVERHIGTVILTVDNEAAPGTRPMHGSGKGLIGMRERASVYGGTVQAGPTPTGWRVRAVLRWDEHDEGTSSWQMPL